MEMMVRARQFGLTIGEVWFTLPFWMFVTLHCSRFLSALSTECMARASWVGMRSTGLSKAFYTSSPPHEHLSHSMASITTCDVSCIASIFFPMMKHSFGWGLGCGLLSTGVGIEKKNIFRVEHGRNWGELGQDQDPRAKWQSLQGWMFLQLWLAGMDVLVLVFILILASGKSNRIIHLHEPLAGGGKGLSWEVQQENRQCCLPSHQENQKASGGKAGGASRKGNLVQLCLSLDFYSLKVSRLAINMEGGFQTNKEVEFEEEVAIVVLPSMQKIEVNNCI